MKKLLALLAAIALLSQPSLASAAPGDAWVPDVQNTANGTARFFIAEDTQGNQVSIRTGANRSADGIDNDWWCADFKTGNCDVLDPKNATNSYLQYSILAPCVNGVTATEDCLDSLAITAPGQQTVQAKFLKNIGGIKFPADTALGLPEANTMSIWDAGSAKSAGDTSEYAVGVRTQSVWDSQLKQFRAISMSATVMPFRLVSGNYSDPFPFTIKNPKLNKTSGVAINGISQECVWNEVGSCGLLQNFTPGTKVKLVMHLSDKIGGWFKGRLANPDVKVTPVAGEMNQIEVEAESVDVARLQTVIKKEDAPSKINDLILRSGIIGGAGPGTLWQGESLFTEGKGSAAFEYLSRFRSYANETAAGVSNVWNFATVQNGGGSECLSNTSKVLGIVTTNAMVYDGSAPSFDTGELTYNVGGLHYMPDGKELVRGTYDLVMRSETARCLYGFSQAPIKASISVIDEGGEAKVATTSVIEKDGWLKLSANNFTFSTPVIKVKLSQPGKKITITCVKGKTTKKVTAVAAKCPAGYKKK